MLVAGHAWRELGLQATQSAKVNVLGLDALLARHQTQLRRCKLGGTASRDPNKPA